MDFTFTPIDSTKGEHKSEEFLAEHPCGMIPILEDHSACIYGGSLVAMKHLCTKYPEVNDRLDFSNNFAAIDKLFGLFMSKIRPTT